MKFCCPNCGREEEILADRNPRCLFCNVAMIAASNYSELWMSPYVAIRRMATISETYGIDQARTDGQFKKEREAWTTAWFALALSKLDGKQWWIEIETKERTPDTRLRHIDQSSGNNVLQTRSIEVVDWEENVADIMEVIEKKCKRAYPEHYFLLVNARHEGKVVHADEIAENIKQLRSPFLEIWLVGRVGLDEIKVLRVAPGIFPIDLKMQAELENAKKQKAFVHCGIRGSGTEIRDLGLAYVPIPRRE